MTVAAGTLSSPLVRRRVFLGAAAIAIIGAALVLGAIGAQEPGLALLAIFVVGAGFACLAWPNASIYITVAILYSNAAAIVVQFHNVPYFVGLAFPLLLLLPLADYLVLQRQKVVLTAAFPWLFGFVIVQLLGTAQSSDIDESINQFMAFAIGGVGLYFLVMNVVRSFDVLRRTVWVILWVSAAISLLSLYQAATSSYGTEFWGFAQVNLPGANTQFSASVAASGTPRLAGPIGEVNRYGQVLLVVLPVGALLAYSEKRRAGRLLAIGLTTVVLLGMATTTSRGAALGLVAVVIAGVFFRYVRLKHLALVALALAVTLFAFPRYGERLLNLQGLLSLDADTGTIGAQGDVGNLRGRATETLAAFLVFVDHPLVGVGPGLFPEYYQLYAERVAAASIDTRIDPGTREAHNLYTHVAAETGILGFTCFMAILLITLRDLRRARRRWLSKRPDIAHLASGFFLAIVAYMVSGIFLHLSYERYFWLLMVLGAVAVHLALTMPGEESGEEAAEGSNPRAPNPRARLEPSGATAQAM
jgi:putative inorganic carbon (hco3(-)) transporter